MNPRFEVYERADGDFGWRLIGGNGEPMAGSEGYTREADAKRGAYAVVAAVLETQNLNDHVIRLSFDGEIA